jgi:hypothetical protein
MRYARATVAATLAVGLLALSPQASAHREDRGHGHEGAGTSVVVEWNRIAQETIFGVPAAPVATPIPSGQVYLGLTSLAVYRAVLAARDHSGRGRASTAAAVAAAAHDVLVDKFPSSAPALDSSLEATLAGVRDGRREDRGAEVGHAAAAAVLAARVGDGWNANITFTPASPSRPGDWRPTPPLFLPMLTPWLGFVRPLVLDSPLQVPSDGPDALTSSDYTRDFAEVKAMGALTGSQRTPAQTLTAKFFNFNVPVQGQTVMREMSADRSPRSAALLFARANVSAADAIIACWRQKYDHGYWRPETAIREAAADGNPQTSAQADWQPLAVTPNYPDYLSGHASLTGAYLRTFELLDGSDRLRVHVPSVVDSVPTSRLYTSTGAWRTDAFNARIWLGYHFRDAMEDGYRLAAATAEIVARRLR